MVKLNNCTIIRSFGKFFVPLQLKNKSFAVTEKDLILEQREKDFLKVFDETSKTLAANHIVFKTVDICRMVANSTAPRFYVSLEQALYQYRLYRKGKSYIRCEERRKMYAEIFTRYEKLMELSGGSAYQYNIMDIVLSQEAPSFYMSNQYAPLFYYKAMNKKRKKTKYK